MPKQTKRRKNGAFLLLICFFKFFVSSYSFPKTYKILKTTREMIKITDSPPSPLQLKASINETPDEMFSQLPQTTTNSFEASEDRRTIITHLFSCLTASISIISYENFDCANLKPQQAALKKSSVKGLGYGAQDRIEGKSDSSLVGSKDESLWDVPSYNEVMLNHRIDRVPRWEKQVGRGFSSVGSCQTMEEAAGVTYQSLKIIEDLKTYSKDYNWDEMRDLLNSSTLNENLENACVYLRKNLNDSTTGSLVDNNPISEIGFDWGSCAWRHCGALADIQEALAELRNYLGLYEPFECLFVLDIAERSLRDIISIIPSKYMQQKIPDYVSYISQSDSNAGGYSGLEENDNGGTTSSLDMDFLSALNQLRNTFSDD